MANFSKTNSTAKEHTLTKMVKNLKVTLKMVKNKEREKSYSQMVEFIMDFGRMIKRSGLPLTPANKERASLGLGMSLLRVLCLS